MKGGVQFYTFYINSFNFKYQRRKICVYGKYKKKKHKKTKQNKKKAERNLTNKRKTVSNIVSQNWYTEKDKKKKIRIAREQDLTQKG